MTGSLEPEATAGPLLPSIDYRQRPARLLEVWRPPGWVMKVYGITAEPEAGGQAVLAPVLLELAKRTARAVLASAEEPGHRIGTLIVHQGRLATWLLVDWWARDVLLHHRLLRRDAGAPGFVPHEGSLAACTWELAILAFERDAWVDCVLKSRAPDRLDAYLARHFDTMV